MGVSVASIVSIVHDWFIKILNDKNILKKKSHRVLFHMKTRVCLKYFVNDYN